MKYKDPYLEHHRLLYLKRHRRMVVFLVFLILVGSLVFFAYFGEGDLTGSVIGGEKKESAKGLVKINADLKGIKELLIVNGEISSIELRAGGSDTNIFIGKQKIAISGLRELSLKITEFDGKISFNSDKISSLGGNAKEVYLNGVPMTSQSGDPLKISFDSETPITYLKLNDTYISRFSYNATGNIKLNNGRLNLELNKEVVAIKGFRGDISIERGRFYIEGFSDSFNTEGESKISVK